MSQLNISGAPRVIYLGSQDLSQPVAQAPSVAATPQFCPKTFLWAQKGPGSPVANQGVGSDIANIYGANTLDPTKSYYNHASAFAEMFSGNGVSQVIERIVPNDATTANMMLVVDVLIDHQLPYMRNDDGSLVYNNSGDPTFITDAPLVPVVTYQFIWVDTSKIALGVAHWEFGKGFVNGGVVSIPINPTAYNIPVRTAADGVTTNKVYPFLEFQASSAGTWGTNSGIQIWAETAVNNTQFPTTLKNSDKVYPFNVAFVTRATANSAAVTTTTILNDQDVTTTFKPTAIDPTTNNQMYIGNNLISRYQNLNNPLLPTTYADWSGMAIYQQNIDHLLNLFTDMEANAIGTNVGSVNSITYDFSSSDFAYTETNVSGSLGTSLVHAGVSVDYDEKYLVNIIGSMTSSGVPYETIRQLSTTISFPMNSYSTNWGFNGFDGTMNDLVFAELVSERMNAYANPNDPVQNMAANPETFFIDSGYPLTTKQALLQALAIRRNTAVWLGTHQVTVSDGTTQGPMGLGNPIPGPVLTMAQEISVGATLHTATQLYPESAYFGTACMRASIFMQSWQILNSLYTNRVSSIYEAASMFSKQAGSSNGMWNKSYVVDCAYKGGNNIVSSLYNPNVIWIPDSIKIAAWSVGLNWVERFDQSRYFFPAFKTVYSGPGSDSSVLNQIPMQIAICTINTISSIAWRMFTNNSSDSPAQMVKNCNKFMANKTNGIFAGMIQVVPNNQFTATDVANQYSWTNVTKLYTNNMKTVMTTYVQAYNSSSYTGK